MSDVASSTMIAVGLAGLREAAELEGAAVLELTYEASRPKLLHECGLGSPAILHAAAMLLQRERLRPSHGFVADRRPLLVCPWILPLRRHGGLAMWRMPGSRGWGTANHVFAASVGGLVRTMMEYESVEVGLDRLTGLPKRDYFLDEVNRHIERLDLDRASGTMMMIDLDGLERLNLRLGRAQGDRMLAHLATALRAVVRPSDIVSRVGPDEFAIWLDGVDHMTAAERADALGHRRLSLLDQDGLDQGGSDQGGGEPDISPTLSIGIATRLPCTTEDAVTLLRRAHMAMREVKQAGGAGWRVSHFPGKG
jgi:diguanylate cyclase (GGDEF)-like protein